MSTTPDPAVIDLMQTLKDGLQSDQKRRAVSPAAAQERERLRAHLRGLGCSCNRRPLNTHSPTCPVAILRFLEEG